MAAESNNWTRFCRTVSGC